LPSGALTAIKIYAWSFPTVPSYPKNRVPQNLGKPEVGTLKLGNQFQP